MYMKSLANTKATKTGTHPINPEWFLKEINPDPTTYHHALTLITFKPILRGHQEPEAYLFKRASDSQRGFGLTLRGEWRTKEGS